jgi:4-amino-4-deoxy-L-arabinose transferase-like glycosyltransferase
MRRRLLLALLAVILMRGLVYVAIMPPWQHYDEPTHFEYVRLIAVRGRLPRLGDYDPQMQREIAVSMRAAGFWRDGEPSFDFESGRPINLGFTQLVHPPLYYVLLALFQPLATEQSVEVQLYLARLGSVALYLVTVVAAYGLLVEMFPWRRWLPLVVATFIALLPPFTDFMTGVNNDVGAVAAATLLLWASVRLIRRGPSLRRWGAVLVLAGACIVTKNTSAAVAVVVLATLAVFHVPQSWRRWLWMGTVVLGLVALPVILTWDRHAAHWYGVDQPAAANRAEVETPLGRSALVLSTGDDGHPGIVIQELSASDGQALRGHTVTFGAWLRAAEGVGGSVILGIRERASDHRLKVEVTSDWQFQAFTATIGLDAPAVAVYALVPYIRDRVPEVHADGLVLVDGQVATSQPPEFDTAQAGTGYWAGRPFTNLLQNGSAERVWPGLQPWIGQRTLYRIPLTKIFHSVWDWSRTRAVYGLELLILFKSFWGEFGWSQLVLPDAYHYPLVLLSAASVIGAAIGLARRARYSGLWEPSRRWAWALLGLVLLVSWGGTVLRIHPVFVALQQVYWPRARYAAVVIAPTAALLCLGLAEIVPRRWLREAVLIGLLGMVSWEMIALWTLILPYHYG